MAHSMQESESSKIARVVGLHRLALMEDLSNASLQVSGNSASRTMLANPPPSRQTVKAKRSRPNMTSEHAFSCEEDNKETWAGSGQTGVLRGMEVESLASKVHSAQPAAISEGVHTTNTEETSSQYQRGAIKKAQADWESHITAMEEVLFTDDAQGFPMGPMSEEALELLSQMVSKLYDLNARVMYTRMQDVMDTHRMNTERIESVFHGLTRVKRARGIPRKAISK